MLELSSLAEKIEDILNTQLSINQQSENTLLANNRVKYQFRVYTDIGEHKGFDYLDPKGEISLEKTNNIVRYIECILTQNDSSVESVNFVNIVRDTELEICIPLNDIELIDNKNSVVNEIRSIIDTAFSKNRNINATFDGVNYEFSMEYSLSNTGERTNRTYIGDSVTLVAYINFYYVEAGLDSSLIVLTIDGALINPIRMGISRGLTQQTNTYSNDTRAVGMNTPTSSLFSINFDLVARTKYANFNEMYKYALTGKSTDSNGYQKPNVAHFVNIAFLQRNIIDGELNGYSVAAETNKLMNFETIGISKQDPLIASMSVTMTETKYIEGLTNLSKYASDNLSLILSEQVV